MQRAFCNTLRANQKQKLCGVRKITYARMTIVRQNHIITVSSSCHFNVCDLLRKIQRAFCNTYQRIRNNNCAGYTQSHTSEWQLYKDSIIWSTYLHFCLQGHEILFRGLVEQSTQFLYPGTRVRLNGRCQRFQLQAQKVHIFRHWLVDDLHWIKTAENSISKTSKHDSNRKQCPN